MNNIVTRKKLNLRPMTLVRAPDVRDAGRGGTPGPRITIITSMFQSQKGYLPCLKHYRMAKTRLSRKTPCPYGRAVIRLSCLDTS